MMTAIQTFLLLACLAAAPLGTAAFAAPGQKLTAGVRTIARSSASPLRMAKEKAEKEGEAAEGEDKKAPPTWMFNKDGVAYAPWMVDTFDPENIKKLEAAIEARKAAKAKEVVESVGDLARDPQAMELSGTGLKTRMVGDEVELEWRTGDESGNKGFIISRRRGKTNDWEQIASYEDWAPLNSKGPQGGVYTYLDPATTEGTWIYRISDMSTSGKRNDLTQALVEVQNKSEAGQVKIAVALIGVVLLGAVASAFLIDPLQ